MDDWSYSVVASGGATFMREVCAPLSEQLEADFPGQVAMLRGTADRTTPPGLETPQGPKALPGAVDAMVGVMVFLGVWGIKRLLDDVYELKIRPRVRKLLGEADKTAQLSSGRSRAFLFAVSYGSAERTVVAIALGETLAEVAANEHFVPEVHLHAYELLERGDQQGRPVLAYLISDGRFSSEPLLFENIVQVHEFLRRQSGPE